MSEEQIKMWPYNGYTPINVENTVGSGYITDIYLKYRKCCVKRRKLLDTSIFSFSHRVF